MATDDVVANLRTKLSGLSGPARTQLLTELGQALAERYWWSGIARPEARPLLDEAIDAVREAHGYLAPTDPLRGRVAAQLGWLLGNRLTIYGMTARDREESDAAAYMSSSRPSRRARPGRWAPRARQALRARPRSGRLGTRRPLCLPRRGSPPVEAVDDLVAVASLVVESEPARTAMPEIEQGEEAIDQFLLAVSLHLRSRVDPIGAAADRRAGAEHLLAAAVRLPSRHPGIVAVLASLGAFVDGPLDGVLGAGVDAYADKVDAVIAAGAVAAGADLATLHALRCLARAAGDPGPADAAALARAVGTVPLDYPWLPQLRAAAAAIHR